MKESYADGLGHEDLQKVIRVDSVRLADESLQDMQFLEREDVDTSVLEHVGGRVGTVFDETCIRKVQAHGLCYISGVGERRSRRRRNHPSGLSGIRPSI